MAVAVAANGARMPSTADDVLAEIRSAALRAVTVRLRRYGLDSLRVMGRWYYAQMGLRKCLISKWIGKALVFPRALLPQVKARPELAQTGVYLLLGPRPDGEGDMLYVGEGDPIRPRLESHYAKEGPGSSTRRMCSFWSRASSPWPAPPRPGRCSPAKARAFRPRATWPARALWCGRARRLWWVQRPQHRSSSGAGPQRQWAGGMEGGGGCSVASFAHVLIACNAINTGASSRNSPDYWL